jgi:hypothetical protein
MQQQLASALAKLIPHYVEAEDWEGLADDLAIYILHHVDDDVASDIMDEINEDAKSLAS